MAQTNRGDIRDLPPRIASIPRYSISKHGTVLDDGESAALLYVAGVCPPAEILAPELPLK